MKRDIRFTEGDGRYPLAVFIHGMGVTADFWTDPSRAKVVGGKYPLGILLPEGIEPLTSYFDLSRMGFSVLTWSQSRPVGPISAAVVELSEILEGYARYARNGILLICHSRGGLVGRKYLEGSDGRLRLAITIATPHQGTSMAKWAAFISPVTSAFTQALDKLQRSDADTALRRILGFLQSDGLRELLPESAFYAGLKDAKRKDARYLSIGGTDPDLLKAIAVPMPELFMKIVPEKIFPEEMRAGRGDGMVTAASSVFPYGDVHNNYHLNHAALLFDTRVRDFIAGEVQMLMD